jgi:hypothetical protein
MLLKQRKDGTRSVARNRKIGKFGCWRGRPENIRAEGTYEANVRRNNKTSANRNNFDRMFVASLSEIYWNFWVAQNPWTPQPSLLEHCTTAHCTAHLRRNYGAANQKLWSRIDPEKMCIKGYSYKRIRVMLDTSSCIEKICYCTTLCRKTYIIILLFCTIKKMQKRLTRAKRSPNLRAQ